MRGVVVATILAMAPEIFETKRADGTAFRCSDTWLRDWLHRTMRWSERKATRAAHKLPKDWEAQCERSFLRMAHDTKEHDIPAELRVNSDQAQGVFAQGCDFTWAATGSKQVPIIGAEEKRAMTIVASVSASGELLPFQAVYGGKTSVSCPSRNAKNRTGADAAGIQFEPSGVKSYWSTHATMHSLVDTIIAPYFERQKTKLGLPQAQKSIWQIDVWSVHRSVAFRKWMKENHSNIIIHFVPAGCTGVFQPCDVGIQRIMKHSLKRSCHRDIVEEILGQLDNNEEVTITKAIGVLRDRTVTWLLDAYTTLNKPQTVKKVSCMSSNSLLSELTIRRLSKCALQANSTFRMRASQALMLERSCATSESLIRCSGKS